ncbi:MAG: aminotransferase class I/II-fold pyridoxal phosphate-dependent enzyme [candidate division Zixibacteria bacterium]|nr:aminotransferase class I/II-fold pyridoxal phosphate-dependent enzyme [candidate division Zixibacteria bacterium]
MLVKKVIIEKANRLYQPPPDIQSFVRPGGRRPLTRRAGVCDLATFRWPVDSNTAKRTQAAQFPPASKESLSRLKQELALWYAAAHRVRLNPTREIHIGGPITTLVFNLALAFIDNGDIAFVPDLGLPLYRKVITACGGEPVGYSLQRRDDWRPGFERVGTRLGRVAKMLFLNSPHNPTGATLTEKELTDLVWLAGRENIMIANDAAYQTVSEHRAVSLLTTTGGKKVGVEVGSFSYHFGLPALPFGFVVGNAEMIAGLQLASQFTPAFIPEAWIEMALEALRQYPNEGIRTARRRVGQSRAEATKIMELLALEKTGQDTVPFVWAKIERRGQATGEAGRLYRRGRILVMPGTAFGESGEGYLRFSLTAPPESYRDACDRLKRRGHMVRLRKRK